MRTTKQQLPDYRASPYFLLDLMDFWNLEIGNIAWSQGQCPRDFPRAQPIFHCISWLESQYRHSQLQLQHCLSWRSILEELILRIAQTAGQYGEILPSRLNNTAEFNFNGYSLLFSATHILNVLHFFVMYYAIIQCITHY